MKIVIEVKDLLELAEMRYGIGRAIREISTELEHMQSEDEINAYWRDVRQALQKLLSQME